MTAIYDAVMQALMEVLILIGEAMGMEIGDE